MMSRGRTALLTSLFLLCALAPPVHSKAPPSRCLGEQLRAQGRLHQCWFKAEARALAHETAPNTARCERTATNDWERILRRGGERCPSGESIGSLVSRLTDHAAALRAGLSAGGLGRHCAANKLRVIARYQRCLFDAEAEAGDAPPAFYACHAKFERRWRHVQERRGSPCQPTDDLSPIRGHVLSHQTAQSGALRGASAPRCVSCSETPSVGSLPQRVCTFLDACSEVDLIDLPTGLGLSAQAEFVPFVFVITGGAGQAGGSHSPIEKNPGGAAGTGGRAVFVETLHELETRYGTRQATYGIAEHSPAPSSGDPGGGGASSFLAMSPIPFTVDRLLGLAGGGGGGSGADDFSQSGLAGGAGGSVACVMTGAAAGRGVDGIRWAGHHNGGAGGLDMGGAPGQNIDSSTGGGSAGGNGVGGTGGIATDNPTPIAFRNLSAADAKALGSGVGGSGAVFTSSTTPGAGGGGGFGGGGGGGNGQFDAVHGSLNGGGGGGGGTLVAECPDPFQALAQEFLAMPNDGASIKAYLPAGRLVATAKSDNGPEALGTIKVGTTSVCDPTCTIPAYAGAVETLSPVAKTGGAFSHWEGCHEVGPGTGPQSNGDCIQQIDAPVTGVTAIFSTLAALTIAKPGTGMGAVTSTPAGIDCGGTCEQSFKVGQRISLRAVPMSGSIWSGWTGDCAGQPMDGCEFLIQSAMTVGAVFDGPELSVDLSGAAYGAVVSTSPDGGITCDPFCAAHFPHGARVTLEARPSVRGRFLGWSGPCAGTSTCVVDLATDTTVRAAFEEILLPLTVTKSGNGSGTVRGVFSGIDCGTVCQANVGLGGRIELVATPAPHSTFAGWAGGGCTGTGVCTEAMQAPTTIDAKFVSIVNLSVNTVDGQVQAHPSGTEAIPCGSPFCVSGYVPGTRVTLTPLPSAPSVFAGWRGGGCHGTQPCVVDLLADTTVTGTFATADTPVAVQKAGTGDATVTSVPVGIDCGTACDANFAHGAELTLTAALPAGTGLIGWSACDGTGSCVLTPAAATTVVATFGPTALFHLDRSVSFWVDSTGANDQIIADAAMLVARLTDAAGVETLAQQGALSLTFVAGGSPTPETTRLTNTVARRGVDPQKPNEISGAASTSTSATPLRVTGGRDPADGSIGLVFHQGTVLQGFLRFVP